MEALKTEGPTAVCDRGCHILVWSIVVRDRIVTTAERKSRADAAKAPVPNGAPAGDRSAASPPPPPAALSAPTLEEHSARVTLGLYSGGTAAAVNISHHNHRGCILNRISDTGCFSKQIKLYVVRSGLWQLLLGSSSAAHRIGCTNGKGPGSVTPNINCPLTGGRGTDAGGPSNHGKSM